MRRGMGVRPGRVPLLRASAWAATGLQPADRRLATPPLRARRLTSDADGSMPLPRQADRGSPCPSCVSTHGSAPRSRGRGDELARERHRRAAEQRWSQDLPAAPHRLPSRRTVGSRSGGRPGAPHAVRQDHTHLGRPGTRHRAGDSTRLRSHQSACSRRSPARPPVRPSPAGVMPLTRGYRGHGAAGTAAPCRGRVGREAGAQSADGATSVGRRVSCASAPDGDDRPQCGTRQESCGGQRQGPAPRGGRVGQLQCPGRAR